MSEAEVELVKFVRNDSFDSPEASEDQAINGDVRAESDEASLLELVHLETEEGFAGPPLYSAHFSTHIDRRTATSDDEVSEVETKDLLDGEQTRGDDEHIDTEGEDDKRVLIKPEEEDGDTTKELTETGEKKYTSSIAGASMNFINSIIGSGIIGIPAALRQSGFLTGMVLLVLVAIVTDYSVILLIKDGFLANKFSYQEMVVTALGRPGYWYLTFAQFFFPFFAMTGYIVIVGDTLSRVIEQIFFLVHQDPPTILVDPRSILIKVLAVALIMMPVSMLRKISRLEKLSGFAVVCIVFIVTVAVYEAANLYCSVRCFKPDCCSSVVNSWIINKDFIQAVGIYAGAFVCHHNTYLIYGSLRRRSLTRFSIVSHISVSSSFIFCIVLGLSGFLTALGETQGDLINNYCEVDPVANATRFFFACVIMFTYPIECFVAREVVEISLSRIPYRSISWIPVPPIRKAFNHFLYAPRHKSLVRHIILTLLLVVTTLAIGVSTNDLEVVLTFNGCFTAIPLAFILPTASYLRLSKTKWYSRGKVIALLVLIFGVIVMFIGTGLAIYQAVESYSHPRSAYHPPYCQRRNSSMEERCNLLYNSTNNFSLSIPLCDCTRLCPNSTILTQLLLT